MGNTPGWAIEVVGEEIEIDDLRRLLPAPYDPWIEDYPSDDGPKAILRSKGWKTVTDVSLIYTDSRRIIELLNGELMLVHSDAKKVEPGKALRFDATGKREPVVFPITGQMNAVLGKIRARIYGTVGAPGVPTESLMQKWFQQAEADPRRAELFVHVNRMDNWYDVYKVMEIARKLVGAKAISSILNKEQNTWRAVWQTANCHRHAPDSTNYPLPKREPTLDQAREFVLKAVAKIIT